MRQMEKLEVFWISWHYLEDKVKKHYGREYDFIDSEEASNDSTYLYTEVNGEIDEWDEEYLDDFFKNGKTNYGLGNVLLQRLVKDGHLPTGDYLVDVCW